MEAYSEGLGTGARFSVTLPLIPPGIHSEALLARASDAIDEEALRGMRILYVEDDPDIGDGCQNMLTALGARVTLCSSFDQARQQIALGGFDLFLSDLNLDHGHKAPELLSLLRTFPHLSHVPALVLSAYGSQQNSDASIAAGFIAHLIKPVTSNELVRALSDALTMSGSRT